MDEADFIAIAVGLVIIIILFILDSKTERKMENRSDIIDLNDVSNLFSKINILFI
jgi:tetrahydromethanopterin S-methyltransferase subunit E